MNKPQEACASPLVSVIIPAYNASAFIEKTLKSVLSQTYQNIEVIVIDDGCEDRTVELVQKIMQQDPRVILLQQVNSGVAAARNLGIENAKGEFIAPIDADDLWYPQNIEKQVQCLLEADDSVGLVYAWSVDINEQDKPTGEFRASTIKGNVYKTLICHNFIGNASAAIFRRSSLEQIGGYNCQLKEQNAQGCEDWELYLKIAQDYQFRVVPEFLIGYRKIVNSMSSDYRKMAKSHALMLEAIQDKQPKISLMVYSLSRSSFYMYLARQSSHYGKGEQTLFWLAQAIKADWITPFFRYGLYVLTFQSLFQKREPELRRFKGLFKFVPQSFLSVNNNYKPNIEHIPTSNSRGFKLRFKLFLGNILHHLLSINIRKLNLKKIDNTQDFLNKLTTEKTL